MDGVPNGAFGKLSVAGDGGGFKREGGVSRCCAKSQQEPQQLSNSSHKLKGFDFGNGNE